MIGSCQAFGVAGGLLGLIMGVGAPDYYRAVFRTGHDPGFSPVRVGLWLGLTQGLVAGAAVGCVVVLGAALSRDSLRK